MQPDADIARVLDKIARVNRGAPAGHPRERPLDPPLPEAGVAAFETQHGIVLPSDYRRFLIQAGNGGGPIGIVGGVYADSHRALWPLEHAVLSDAAGFLAAPFDPESAVELGDGACFRGLLVLGQDGCGFMACLVLSGDLRGSVISFDGSTAYVTAPDFLTWYEQPLDHVLR